MVPPPRTRLVACLIVAVLAVTAGVASASAAKHHGGHHARSHHRHHKPHRRHRPHRHHSGRAHHKPKRPPTYAPPAGKLFHGVSDTKRGVRDVKLFQHQVQSHPAVLEDFYHWDTPVTTGALQRWKKSRSRGVLSLSTAPGGKSELISPRKMSLGQGDQYIAHLAQSIAKSKQVVYIRLMPEMNGHWNPYCAYNGDGTKKGINHSTKAFRQAWRRFAIVMRGGTVKSINAQLKKLHMPRLLNAKSNHDPIYVKDGVGKRVQKPRVALIWNPQTVGSPNVSGNSARRYWPGAKYVDWVGADIYSKFASPGIRSALSRFYSQYSRFPFMIGEYSAWNNDHSGSFVRWLFRWARDHGRTRMLVYYRSVFPNSPFDIEHYPGARSALRHELNSKRFMEYPPGGRRHHHGHHHHR
jgi:Ni/Co efflux regulator RcnB